MHSLSTHYAHESQSALEAQDAAYDAALASLDDEQALADGPELPPVEAYLSDIDGEYAEDLDEETPGPRLSDMHAQAVAAYLSEPVGVVEAREVGFQMPSSDGKRTYRLSGVRLTGYVARWECSCRGHQTHGHCKHADLTATAEKNGQLADLILKSGAMVTQIKAQRRGAA